MTDGERRQLEGMMRVVVSMQGLLDAILFAGQTLLDQPVNAPREVAQSAGAEPDAGDPLHPIVFHGPRASVPTKPED